MTTVYGGLKVLEIADVKAMYCGKILAGLGAEVIKIERPGGDDSRNMGPFKHGEKGVENSLSFAYLNTGKKDITLNLSIPEGKDIFLQLATKADVVIETFSPGTMKRWGAGYETLNQFNPGIILLSITPFGQTGPHSQWKASTDLIVDAMGGPMSETGYVGRAPLHLGYDMQANACSMYGLFAVQAAYHNRLFTGKGTHIDISQQECFAAWCDQAFGIAQVTDQNPPREKIGKDYVRQGLVNCKNGFAFLMIGGKWKELLQWFSDEGLDISVFDDPKYEAHVHEVRTPWDQVLLERLNQLGSLYTKTEFMEEGQRRRIPIGIVETPDTMLNNEQLKARNYFVEVDHPVIGRYLYPGAPASMSESPYVTGAPAPMLGADNSEVYGSLGYTEKEIADLTARGVI
jgi:crotonobetainyl-CoA:carnitine CoA-transferase CaiB-like acyl-CoA transferase